MGNDKYQLLLAQMAELKILTENEKELLKTKTNELKWEIEIFPESMILIPSILKKLSKAILDYCERAIIPPDYDHLLIEIFHLIGLNENHPEFNLDYQKNDQGKDFYKLSLIFEKTLFERELLDIGDYYDILNVQKLVNEVLLYSGAKFELISIETGDQGFCLFKGEREKILNLYKLYHQEYLIED